MPATFSGRNFVGSFDAAPLIAKVRSGADRGVMQAGAALQGHYRLMLNRPGPRRGRRSGKLLKGETVRPSEPGEPPRYRERDLINSVQVIRLGTNLAAIGTHLLYGLYLELGAPNANLRPRPWLRPGLAQMATAIKAIILSNTRRG